MDDKEKASTAEPATEADTSEATAAPKRKFRSYAAKQRQEEQEVKQQQQQHQETEAEPKPEAEKETVDSKEKSEAPVAKTRGRKPGKKLSPAPERKSDDEDGAAGGGEDAATSIATRIKSMRRRSNRATQQLNYYVDLEKGEAKLDEAENEEDEAEEGESRDLDDDEDDGEGDDGIEPEVGIESDQGEDSDELMSGDDGDDDEIDEDEDEEEAGVGGDQEVAKSKSTASGGVASSGKVRKAGKHMSGALKSSLKKVPISSLKSGGVPKKASIKAAKDTPMSISGEISASGGGGTEDACFLNPTLAAFNFGNLFYCNFCGFSANNTNKILHHLFIHVFKCNACSHFTYTKYDLMRHIYKHHRPNKELKIKRLVLEVTSNDWYFLCSENEPHSLNAANSSSAASSANNSLNEPSPATTLELQTKAMPPAKVLPPVSAPAVKTPPGGGARKPVVNYFLTQKQQKQPEKLTPVIQSNKAAVSVAPVVAEGGEEAKDEVSGGSHLQKLMQKEVSTKVAVPPVIGSSKLVTATVGNGTPKITPVNNAGAVATRRASAGAVGGGQTVGVNQKLMGFIESADAIVVPGAGEAVTRTRKASLSAADCASTTPTKAAKRLKKCN